MNNKNTALILLELQNDFLSDGGVIAPMLKEVIDEVNVINNLKGLIAGARQRDFMIIHVPIQFSDDYVEMGPSPQGILNIVKSAGALKSGTWGCEIADFAAPHPGEYVVKNKSNIDSFCGTNLDYYLRANGISNLAIAGQLTNICIESTMRTAYDKGYKVFGLTDCSATIGMSQYKSSIAHNWPMFSTPITHGNFLHNFFLKR